MNIMCNNNDSIYEHKHLLMKGKTFVILIQNEAKFEKTVANLSKVEIILGILNNFQWSKEDIIYDTNKTNMTNNFSSENIATTGFRDSEKV